MSNDDKILDALNAIRLELAAIRAANSPKVTIEQAELLLNCGKTTIYDLIKSGALKKATGPGKESLLTSESVLRVQREGVPVAPRPKRAPRAAEAANQPTDEDLKLLTK